MDFELLLLLLPHNYIQLWLAGCLFCPVLPWSADAATG
jgi:hypothetical protein